MSRIKTSKKVVKTIITFGENVKLENSLAPHLCYPKPFAISYCLTDVLDCIIVLWPLPQNQAPLCH